MEQPTPNRENADAANDTGADNVVGLPSIELVFARLANRPLRGDLDRDERRDFCLVHDDLNTPSCDYNVARGVWHCHSCGEHGGVFDLVQAVKHLDRKATMKWLRDENLLAASSGSWWDRVTTIYRYTNRDNIELYQVGRKNLGNGKKDFRQRRPRPDGNEGFINDLKGVTRVPYNLPALAEACEQRGVIYVVEGEKDANRLCSLGLVATTNAQGANWPWPESWSDFFKGASRVVVLGDNDDAGREAAELRASICALVVPDTRIIVALPGVGIKGDVSDWLDLGHTAEELVALASTAPVAQPYKPEYPRHVVHKLVADPSDTGNADWFVACCGNEAIYVPRFKNWMVWDQARWVDGEALIGKLVRTALDKMRLAARDYTGPASEAFKTWSIQAGEAKRRSAMLSCAKGECAVDDTELDAHRTLLNVQNGILNCETGELMPHDPSQLLTKIAPVTFDPEARCPRWEAWLDEQMEHDTERVEYIQQIMGGMLVARAGTRRLFFAYGPPGGGKSTITRVASAILGDYHVSIDFAALAAYKNKNASAASPELARLRGARAITAVESNSSVELDVAKLKQFVGADLVTARNVYQGIIEFPIEGTLLLSGNDKPRINGDDSIWSKLKLIPFEHQIAKQNLQFFEEILEPELPGILNWMLAGLRKLSAAKWQLADPAAVVEATAEYRAEQNLLTDFVETWCDTATGDTSCRIQPQKLYEAYGAYCASTNRTRQQLGEHRFRQELQRLGFKYIKSQGINKWNGINVKPEKVNQMEQVGSAAQAQPPQTRRSRDYDREEPDF